MQTSEMDREVERMKSMDRNGIDSVEKTSILYRQRNQWGSMCLRGGSQAAKWMNVGSMGEGNESICFFVLGRIGWLMSLFSFGCFFPVFSSFRVTLFELALELHLQHLFTRLQHYKLSLMKTLPHSFLLSFDLDTAN